MKVEKISGIQSLYPIPIEHHRWAGFDKATPEKETLVVEVEANPVDEKESEFNLYVEDLAEDPGLYNRWGKIKKNNLPKLIKII